MTVMIAKSCGSAVVFSLMHGIRKSFLCKMNSGIFQVGFQFCFSAMVNIKSLSRQNLRRQRAIMSS